MAIFFVSLLLIGCKPDEADTHVTTPYVFNIPAGYPQPIYPTDNVATEEGVKLGRHLFYDRRLSETNVMSCATCHKQEFAFSDPLRFSFGIFGDMGTRNSMALVNLAFSPNQHFFWDGRAQTLEIQVFEPVTNPIEMASSWHTVVNKLKAVPAYKQLFKDAFGSEEIDSVRISKALSQFMRTMVSFNSPFDKWARGEGTLTPQQINGLNLMQSLTKGDCFHCHNSEDRLFSRYGHTNNGLDEQAAWSDPNFDFGLYRVTGNPADRAKFKVPTLRNIMLTAPYMHDGRFATMEDVLVGHYLTGGKVSETIDPLMEFSPVVMPNNPGLNLTPQDIQDIIAFLHTLTDMEFVNDQQFSNPW